MNRSRYSIPLLLLVSILVSASVGFAQEHWDPPINQGNMSVLVDEATLDGESLVLHDEIGVFTPDGILAGAYDVRADGFPVGVPTWGDDQDAAGINGFREGEQLFFKVWDHAADEEWDADPEVTWGEGVYSRDAFIAVNLTAIREALPEINVAENGHDFGAVRVGRSATWEFAIESVGNSPLTVESIQSNNNAFTTNFGNAVEIPNGESHAVIVTFTPDAAGDFAADLTITSDATENSSYVVSVTATGEEALPPDIALSAADRRFGRIIVGQSRNMSLFIINEGDQSLTVSEIATGNGVFNTDFDGAFEIAGGARQEIVVSFTPEAAVAYESDLSITSNDPDENVVSIPLFGEGRDEGEPAVAATLVTEYFYGAAVVGTSLPWRMVVTNSGGSDLMVTNVTSDNEVFAVEFGGDAIRLRPGDYLYVNTSFNPAGEFFYDGNFTVFSDDQANGELTIPVAGSGVAANGRYFHAHNTGASHSVLVTATTLEGNVLREGSEVAVFTQSGLCAGAGAIGRDGQVGIAAYGDDESTDIVDGFAAGESFSFKVWDANARVEAWGTPDFEEGPEAYEDRGITVLAINANLGDPIPDIAISDIDYYYGQVAVGEFEDWVLTLTNQGRGTLHVMSVEPDLNEFTTNFDGEFDLNLGASRDITVRFAPTEENAEYNGRLTVRSDDPVDSVLYVDLFGLGVDVPREPEIHLGSPSHFFGALPLNSNGSYVLRIHNNGGGLMRLESIAVEGSNAFTTDWAGNPRNIDANSFYDLNITYHPVQAGTHAANVIITSDDPNNGQVSFLAEGDGVNEASHFHHRITDGNHSLLITHAILEMPGDRSSPLAPGDEIAVYTANGLCAGHSIVEEQGAQVGVAAWGDDRGTEVVDGFVDGEEFTWLVWDRSTRQELAGRPVWANDEPMGFQSQAQGFLDSLVVFSDVVEAQIAVEPAVYNFGPVHVNSRSTHDFRISNTGGVDLTISRIVSNMNVFTHNFNNQATVLEAGESIDVTVTFTPDDGAVFEGVMTVFSDDPDQEQFIFRPGGIGSESAGHFDYIDTDQNHSILVDPFLIGGVGAEIGDQVGVFTAEGYCAGAGIVENAGTCGIAAWRDDPDTRYVVEGFGDGDEMTLKVWDASQRREHSEFNLEVEEGGSMNFEANAITFVHINVEGVVVVAADPPEAQVREGEEVNVHITIANAPGNMALSFINPGEIAENAGNVTFTDHGNNTADFRWVTNFNAFRNRPYTLNFQASNGEITDVTSVLVTIVNVNQRPIVANPFQNDMIVINEDQQMAGAPPRYVVIPNLNNVFSDPDGDPLSYLTVAINPNITNEHRTTAGVPRWQIDVPANFFGDVSVTLRADDGRGGAPERDLRRVEGGNALEANLSNPSGSPERDLVVDYRFTLRFTSVNDLPVISAPANAANFVWNINERQDATLDFNGADVESQGDQIVWTMPNRGNLPDEAEFTDNRNGTARLHWQPTVDDVGQYNTVVRMADADNGTDEIAVTINVANINDPPVYNDDHPIADVELQEDCERTVIATLNDNHWIDPDVNDVLTFGIANAPAELQAQYSAQSTEVSVMPRANINGEFDVIVFCRDRAAGGNEDRHTIHVTIVPVNDAPTFVPPAINNINVAEDSNLGPLQIARLNLKFRDVDAGDVLAYSVEGPAELGLRIDNATTALFRQLTANYNTAALAGGTAVITVIATDQAGESVQTQFNFTVTPVNDLPLGAGNTPADSVFRLLTPVDRAAVDTTGALRVSWASAPQNQWEIDRVAYRFAIVREALRDTFFVPLFDTSFTIPNLDSLARRLLPNRENPVNVVWWVSAADADGNGARFWARRGPRIFTIPALEVIEIPNAEMPQDYFISNSYPNPFNGRTTLQFGLPTPGEVEVSVWDMHGRKVAELAAGYHQAGQYELTWTADGMTSGIYLIKMQSGAFVGMQKAILVR